MRAQEEAAGTCVADRLNQINLGVNIFLHAYTRRTEMVQTRLRAFAFCAYMNNNRAPLRHAMHPPADRKTTSTHQQLPAGGDSIRKIAKRKTPTESIHFDDAYDSTSMDQL